MDQKKVVRPKEERIKKIDDSIAYHEKCIENLKMKRERIVNPAPRKNHRIGLNSVVKKAKELGMTPEEMMQKLIG